MFWEDHGRPTFVWLFRMTAPALWLMPAVGLALWARHRLRSARRRPELAREPADFTGARAASAVLGAAGVAGVAIIEASGPLADFYDASRRELRLSAPTWAGRSPWALAVASREAGHALAGRWASKTRTALVFASRLGALVGWITFAAGFALDYAALARDGALIISAAALAALALVPIESAAIRRALASGALDGVAHDPDFTGALAASRLAHVAAILPFGLGRSS
jgi:Zn-dependent membrane protease YugP